MKSIYPDSNYVGICKVNEKKFYTRGPVARSVNDLFMEQTSYAELISSDPVQGEIKTLFSINKEKKHESKRNTLYGNGR